MNTALSTVHFVIMNTVVHNSPLYCAVHRTEEQSIVDSIVLYTALNPNLPPSGPLHIDVSAATTPGDL